MRVCTFAGAGLQTCDRVLVYNRHEYNTRQREYNIQKKPLHATALQTWIIMFDLCFTIVCNGFIDYLRYKTLLKALPIYSYIYTASKTARGALLPTFRLNVSL